MLPEMFCCEYKNSAFIETASLPEVKSGRLFPEPPPQTEYG